MSARGRNRLVVNDFLPIRLSRLVGLLLALVATIALILIGVNTKDANDLRNEARSPSATFLHLPDSDDDVPLFAKRFDTTAVALVLPYQTAEMLCYDDTKPNGSGNSERWFGLKASSMQVAGKIVFVPASYVHNQTPTDQCPTGN